MATIKDVAKRAGVAASTVSAALNGTAKVRREVVERIKQAAAELHYTPSASARALKRGTTGLIGLVVADITNPFYGELTAIIERAAHEAGYALILCSTNWDAERERRYLDLMISHSVDGLIVSMSGPESRRALMALAARDTPIVMVDQVFPGLSFDSVLLDNFVAAQRAVDHLVSFGHTRIGMIAGPLTLPTGDERFRAFKAALGDQGLVFDPALVADGEFTIEGGYAAAQRLLTLDDPPTAIFGVNNTMTIGLMKYIAERGIRCPAEVSIICVDDFPTADAMTPRLTTLAQPTAEIGRRALEQLVARLRNPRTGEILRHVFEPTLRVRDSCGPPPARTSGRTHAP